MSDHNFPLILDGDKVVGVGSAPAQQAQMHVMDFWLRQMEKYAWRCLQWEMARQRAYKAAYACGYLERDQ